MLLEDWVRSIRGRVCREYVELIGVVQNFEVDSNCKDKWRWILGEDGEFSFRELASVIEEKVLRVESEGQETLWNNLVPKKVNIFVWRALRGRLPVHVKLNKREIDLDSVLCPCCNNIVETCTHSLVTCDLAMSVWNKVCNCWNVWDVNVFTIGEIFAYSGDVNVPISLAQLSYVHVGILMLSRLHVHMVEVSSAIMSASFSLQHVQKSIPKFSVFIAIATTSSSFFLLVADEDCRSSCKPDVLVLGVVIAVTNVCATVSNTSCGGVPFKPYVQVSKAKKAAKNHDPLAILAHLNASSSHSHANSSYSPQLYYVTHPSSVADYEDEY
ncbi:RNA-directed DNA polymerase, eukaryota, reverse transcriptase zinc-binding domain protein [Tanacetum coccineum]